MSLSKEENRSTATPEGSGVAVAPEFAAEEKQFYRNVARSCAVESYRQKARKERAVAIIVAFCTAGVIGLLLALVYHANI